MTRDDYEARRKRQNKEIVKTCINVNRLMSNYIKIMLAAGVNHADIQDALSCS